MVPDNTFLGAYLKIERAKGHLAELVRITQPLNTAFYDAYVRESTGRGSGIVINFGAPNANNKTFEIAYVPKKPVRQMLATYIGDIIHNLAAALDYSATLIVRTCEGDARFVSFPRHDTRKQFVSSGLHRDIETCFPSPDKFFKFLIDEVKPYGDGNKLLYSVSKLDKIDKHNFILPIVTVGMMKQAKPVMVSGNLIDGNSVSGDANTEIIFGPVTIPEGVSTENFQMSFSTEILFPQGSILEGLVAIPTLTDMINTVTQTVESVEEFVLNAGVSIQSSRVNS